MLNPDKGLATYSEFLEIHSHSASAFSSTLNGTEDDKEATEKLKEA